MITLHLLNEKKQKIDFSEKFSSTDSDKWDLWLYNIKKKLDINAPLYKTEKHYIAYILFQTNDILFKGM